jgi:hypothetical protein
MLINVAVVLGIAVLLILTNASPTFYNMPEFIIMMPFIQLNYYTCISITFCCLNLC